MPGELALVSDPPSERRTLSPPCCASSLLQPKNMARQKQCPKALTGAGTGAVQGRPRRLEKKKTTRHECLAEKWLAFVLPPSPGHCFWCQRLMIENSPWL